MSPRLARPWIGLLICALVPPAMGGVAMLLDQDANWDLRNYHWYNAHAFLTGRFGFDIAPAHTATFYNPLLDVPFYLLAQAVPARTAGFALGFVQGLNAAPLYLLARRLAPAAAGWGRGAGGAILAVAGLAGGGHFGLIGTTFYDNVLSILVLGALALALAADARSGVRRGVHFALAGLAIGAATGLKLPVAVFAFGLGLAALAAHGPVRTRLIDAAVLAAAGVAGLAATGGFWMARLWQAFANPIFPYFNALFGSPMALPASYRDTRFVPESVLDALTLPLRAVVDPRAVGEIDFTDARIAAATIVGLITLAMALLGRLSALGDAERGALRFAGVFAAVSLAAWLALFAIYRYVVALELLAPVLIAACVAAWPMPRRAQAVVLASVLALLVVTTRGGTWGRVPWNPDMGSASFVEVAAPALPDPGNTLVLISGFAPVAWVIPAFAPEAAFVRIQGYSNHPDDGDAGLARQVAQRIRGHAGALHLLTGRADLALAGDMLARYGLAADAASCTEVRSNLAVAEVDLVVLCPVRRIVRP
ncbi:MAG: hypothetical protein SFV21_06585 [Rhodospirillaceae bacterium]|nr:hypothetical protein [Rhodospirillaceae bacterium]